MPLRDLLVLALIFGSLPFCFLNPFIGVLIWSWIAYMNPHRLTWRVAYNFPVAQLPAIATLAGFPFTRKSLPVKREAILMLLLWLIFTITSFFAILPRQAWTEWTRVSKILLMTFITMCLVTNRKRLKYLLIVIALSLGFYGLRGGIFALLSGGKYRVYGPPRSFIGDNNDLALALNMILPLLILLHKEVKSKSLKLLFLSTFFLTIIAIMFTYSRGGFVGLAFILCLLMLKSRKKILFVLTMLGGIIVIPYLNDVLPERWINRIISMRSYREDRAAMGRIEAWKFGWSTSLKRPLIGGGFKVFDGYYGKAAHSIYFQILGEHGFIAFGIFIALLGSSLLSLRRLRKLSKEDPKLQWLYDYSNMLEISLLAYMISGAFLSRAYFDLLYHLIAIVIVLKCLAERKEEQTIEEPYLSTYGRIYKKTIDLIVKFQIRKAKRALNRGD